MIINVILGIALIVAVIIIISYKLQIISISKEIDLIIKNKTNKVVSSEILSVQVKKLTDSINELINKERNIIAECEKKDIELKNTITDLSHDIRTPLTSIEGYLDLLKNCDNEDDKERYYKIVSTRVDSLKEILEQLFTFVKLENNSYNLEL